MDQEFVSTTRRPQVAFLREGVPPPSALYIFRDDSLNVESWGSVAGVGLLIAARVMLPDGQITQFVFNHTPSSDRSRGSTDYQLTEGFLLGFTIIESTALVKRGQVFARANLIRGVGAAARLDQVLCEGYVAQFQPLWWPPGKQNSSVEGPGIIRTILGTDPAAGVQFSETVPTNARWRLIALTVSLVTDATAANRRLHLVIDDGTNISYITISASAQTASLTRFYSFGAGSGQHDVRANTYLETLPVDLVLLAGTRIYAITDAMQAGDNYTAPVLQVEEWIEE